MIGLPSTFVAHQEFWSLEMESVMWKILVLTMAVALVVLMGSSAQATIRDITDPSGDVVRVTSDRRATTSNA